MPNEFYSKNNFILNGRYFEELWVVKPNTFPSLYSLERDVWIVDPVSLYFLILIVCTVSH